MLNNPVSSIPTYGSYTGDNAADRAIPHGLTHIPGLVIIQNAAGNLGWAVVMVDHTNIYFNSAGADAKYATSAPTVDYFYVGNAGSLPNSMNAVGQSYIWTAI